MFEVRVDTTVSRDMRSVISQSAAQVLPSGFAEYWTDLVGSADHNVSFSLNLNSTAIVQTESGGKRRLTTQAVAGVAEILPYYNQAAIGATEHAPTMINPKTSAWYAEGRAAIETHGANSLLFPCSIALTSGSVMQTTLALNTFVALGLAGTGYAGGSTSFLSFAASSGGVMTLQTTTIPWTATTQSYALYCDGAGTITARAYAADGTVAEWTTTNLTGIGGAAGYHPHQWCFATDATPTTMLCDYIYGAGPRV